jgi:hypothetical protein
MEYKPQIREIICTGRYCENVIALVYDEQYVQSGGMLVYHSFKPFCAKCNKPSAAWHPSDIEIEGEQYQSRLEFQREILRSLADNEKFKKQKKIK